MLRIDPFNKNPFKYDQWFIKNKFAYESELLAIKSQIPYNKCSIEIGVGSGRFAGPLDIKLGVEPSIKMQMFSKKRKIDIINSIAENLPFKSNFFDLILMVTTICFINDIDSSFKETFRILKKDGIFIIGFIDRNSPIGKLYQHNKKSSVFYSVANFYTVNEVINLLKDANFSDLNFVQTLFHPLNEIKQIEPYKSGYGKGSFVVIKSMKG
jgi:ubiquinone/menaquinone biosynthesis C-methylase UbiE